VRSSPQTHAQPQAAHRAAEPVAGEAARVAVTPKVSVGVWDPDTSNTTDVEGHIKLNGSPVQGVLVKVDGWLVPQLTDNDGTFTYPADNTMPARHVVRVVDASKARIDGHNLSASQQQAVMRASGGISVGYTIDGL